MDGLKPGKKAIARIVFQTNNLGIKDASDLEKIEFKLKIRDADNSDILVETDIITLSFNSHTSATEEKKNEEKILYSDDNFKVTYVGIEESSDDWTASMNVILLKVENHSDQNISISLYETYINDTLVTFFGGISDMDGLKPGKKAIARIGFQTNNLGIKDASDLEKIEFKLKIRGADYSNILVETDIITLSFQ